MDSACAGQHSGAAPPSSPDLNVLRLLCVVKAAGSKALRPSVVFFIVLVFGLLACLPTALADTSQNKHADDGKTASEGFSVPRYDAHPPFRRTPTVVAPAQARVGLQGGKGGARQVTKRPTLKTAEPGTLASAAQAVQSAAKADQALEGAAGLDKGVAVHGRVLQGAYGEGADTINMKKNEVAAPGGGRGGSWIEKAASFINYHGRRMLATFYKPKAPAAEATVHTDMFAVLPGPNSGPGNPATPFNATLTLNQSAVTQAAYTRHTDAGGVAIVATVDVPPEAFLSSAGPGASAADAPGVASAADDGSEMVMVNITVTVSVTVPVKVTATPPAVPNVTSTGAGAGVVPGAGAGVAAGAAATASKGADLQQAMSTRPVTPGYTAKSFISYLLGHAARPGVQGPLRAIARPLPVGPGGPHHNRRLQGMSRIGDNTAVVQKSGTPTLRTSPSGNGQRPVRVPYNNSSTARNRTAAEGTN